jgi:hypothetical protein
VTRKALYRGNHRGGKWDTDALLEFSMGKQ